MSSRAQVEGTYQATFMSFSAKSATIFHNYFSTFYQTHFYFIASFLVLFVPERVRDVPLDTKRTNENQVKRKLADRSNSAFDKIPTVILFVFHS